MIISKNNDKKLNNKLRINAIKTKNNGGQFVIIKTFDHSEAYYHTLFYGDNEMKKGCKGESSFKAIGILDLTGMLLVKKQIKKTTKNDMKS